VDHLLHAFKESCENSGQRLTFCGANAHFQNGIAERAIWEISESAQKQLLHAHARWIADVHFALWPYAIQNAVLLYNSLPVLEDGTGTILSIYMLLHALFLHWKMY